MSRIPFCMVVLTALLTQLPTASASFLIIDNFEDGDIFDGDPLEWRVINPAGQSRELDSRDGSLYMEQTGGELVQGFRVAAFGAPFAVDDVLSARTRVRLLSPGRIGVQVGRGGLDALAGISDTGRINGGNDVTLGQTPYRPLEEDVLIQVDLIEDTAEFRFWSPSEAKPAEPLVTIDNLGRARGTLPRFITVIGADEFTTMAGIYRYVVLSDSVIPADFVIPEPTTLMIAATAVVCLLPFRRGQWSTTSLCCD